MHRYAEDRYLSSTPVLLHRCQHQRVVCMKQRAPTRRQLGDMSILAHIRNAFALSRGTYGSPCMHIALDEVGIALGRHRTQHG